MCNPEQKPSPSPAQLKAWDELWRFLLADEENEKAPVRVTSTTRAEEGADSSTTTL